MNNKIYKLLFLILIFFFLVYKANAKDDLSSPAIDIYNKALKYYQAKNYRSAIEYFHQYLAEYSDTPLYITCLYYLAFSYQKTDDIKQAVLLYHKVIDGALGKNNFWRDMSSRRLMDLGEL